MFAGLFVATGMAVEESCLLVLIQCCDREWYGGIMGREAWTWDGIYRERERDRETEMHARIHFQRKGLRSPLLCSPKSLAVPS